MNRIAVALRMFMLLFLLMGTSRISFAQQAPDADKQGEVNKKVSADGSVKITLKVPISSPRFSDVPVALVNDDSITISDLVSALAAFHESKMGNELENKVKMDYAELLQRLINVQLVIQEARNIGFDELPEYKDSVARFSKNALRKQFLISITKDIKADDKRVESIVKDTVTGWKVISVVFLKEDQARQLEERVKGGEDFEGLVQIAIQQRTVFQGGLTPGFIKASSLNPAAKEALSKMKVGSVSPVIRQGKGKDANFTVIKLVEIGLQETPKIKEDAESQALVEKKLETVDKYRKMLYKKNVTFNKKLIKGLDYDSGKPGIEAWLKDKRTIVEVKGEKPVTVQDLSEAIQRRFFHGVDVAAKDKRINEKKDEFVSDIVDQRVFVQEAKRIGLDKTPEYRNMVRDYENSLLFGAFIEKVVLPDVTVSDQEKKAYYQQHLSDYTYPEMMRLRGLAFGNEKDAVSALGKLQKGADYVWLKENAKGLVDNNAEGVMNFEDNLLVTKDFSEDMRKALAGAREGEYRLSTGPGGYFYVLSIRQVVPSRQQSFEDAQGDIAKQVYNEKLDKAMNEWFEKIRKTADIRIYLAGNN